MIKVAHIITGLSTGGAEMMLYKLLRHIDRSKFNNVVISITGKGIIGRKIEDLGITVYSLNLHNIFMIPVVITKLVYRLRKEKVSIVQTWLYHADLLGLLAAKLAKIQTVIWNIRCSELPSKSQSLSLILTLKILTWLSGIPKAIIVNSNAGKQVHSNLGYKSNKWILIPNGFDTNKFSPSKHVYKEFRADMDFNQDSIIIGLIARYHPMKDHIGFIEAIRLVCDVEPEVKCVLVGKGVDTDNQRIVNHIQKLELIDSVYLLGEKDDIPNITKSLDIAVSSSVYGEGFPNVIGEAMASGVPCVVTDVGDSAYIVGETGRVIQPSNPHALADAILSIVHLRPNERRALGNSARERIISRFSINKVVMQYEKVYGSLYA